MTVALCIEGVIPSSVVRDIAGSALPAKSVKVGDVGYVSIATSIRVRFLWLPKAI